MQPPLANDKNGIAIDVPEGARAWRVKRMTGKKGEQTTLYANGRPLEIRIDDDAEALKRAIEAVGVYGHAAGFKYRLEAVDEDGRSVGAVAFVELYDEEARPAREDDEETAGGGGAPVVAALGKLTSLLEELLRAERSTREELIRAVRTEHEDDRRMFREVIKTQSEALSNVSQGLARGYTTVTPAPEQPFEPEPAQPPEEKSIAEQIGEILKAAPDAVQAIQAIRGLVNAGGSNGAPPNGDPTK
jgi:hypothetical protein